MLAAIVTALFAATFLPHPSHPLSFSYSVHSRVVLFSHSTIGPTRGESITVLNDFVAFLSKSQEDRAFQWSEGIPENRDSKY